MAVKKLGKQIKVSILYDHIELLYSAKPQVFARMPPLVQLVWTARLVSGLGFPSTSNLFRLLEQVDNGIPHERFNNMSSDMTAMLGYVHTPYFSNPMG